MMIFETSTIPVILDGQRFQIYNWSWEILYLDFWSTSLVVICCGYVYLQVTSISPEAGSEGDEVTIDGTGFSANADENIVMIGQLSCVA